MKRLIASLVVLFGIFAVWAQGSDYEEFTGSGDDFDLEGCQLRFDWTGTAYTSSTDQIFDFPVDPSSHTDLKPLMLPNLDNGSAAVALTGSETISLYGVTYSTVHVGSNGYISLGAADTAHQALHFFNVPRIAGLYTDLDLRPGLNHVSYAQLSDRIVVTYRHAEQANTAKKNDFQIEVSLDSSSTPGQIRLSWVRVQAGIDPNTFPVFVGLSSGSTPSPLLPEDFSAAPSASPSYLSPHSAYRALGIAGTLATYSPSSVDYSFFIPGGTPGKLEVTATTPWAGGSIVGSNLQVGNNVVYSGFSYAQAQLLLPGVHEAFVTFRDGADGMNPGTGSQATSQVILTLLRPDPVAELFAYTDFDLHSSAL